MISCLRPGLPIKNRVYCFLALCARAECDARHYDRLAQAAVELKEWDGVSAQAEAQGLGPLLYVHLKGAGVEPPLAVKRELQGLYLRHRDRNRVQTRLLGGILAAYEGAGIPALLLKGAALSHLVYPEPGLRPMSDVDILVPEAEAQRAQQVLAELGFAAPLSSDAAFSHRHLPGATLRSEGITIGVEIHHKLFSDYFGHAVFHLRSMILPIVRPVVGAKAFSPGGARRARERAKPYGLGTNWMALDGLTGPPHSFDLGEMRAYTLGYEDMLEHLCQHLSSHVNVWDYGRLIWMADIVSLAERFVGEIDWERVRRRYPAVLDMLSLLHFMTPLSERLLGAAPIKIGRAPEGIGVEYQGWPRTRVAGWRERGYRRVLRDTLFPSEWWLRLRYKLGSARSLFWYRWLRHPLYILGHVARACLERVGWPTPSELVRGHAPK